ncbi:MAG: uroporphyrinogen decarboxylase family protein [Anaerolineales bacterium]
MSKISNSFDRFLTAIHRREPDRVPFGELGIDPEVKQAFMGHPVLTPKDDLEFFIAAGYDYVLVDTDLYATPQIQGRIIKPHSDTASAYAIRRPDRNWVDAKTNAIQTWEDVEKFPWPTAEQVDCSIYSQIKPLLPPEMKLLVTFGHIYTMAMQLMGFESFCIKLMEDPPLVMSIIDRLGNESMRLLERILSFDDVGAVCIQDDIAYTSGLMVSPRSLRKIFFPWLTRAAEISHSYNRPLIYHSDGKVDEVLPDIIAAGVDALHPIEPKCMNIGEVKLSFGQQIALIGNVDLGYTLTRGTPQEVRQEVRTLIKKVGQGGGYLMSSANSVTNYVPLANYKAMLEATIEYGRYPISL